MYNRNWVRAKWQQGNELITIHTNVVGRYIRKCSCKISENNCHAVYLYAHGHQQIVLGHGDDVEDKGYNSHSASIQILSYVMMLKLLCCC